MGSTLHEMVSFEVGDRSVALIDASKNVNGVDER